MNKQKHDTTYKTNAKKPRSTFNRRIIRIAARKTPETK